MEKDARFWDRWAKRYAKSAISDLQGYERTLERTRIQLHPTDHVLELGCGTGTTALRLAANVASYLATDISGAMIEIAREKLSREVVPPLVFRRATVDDLVVEETRFDTVLGFNWLHLVRDVPATLSNIRALLRPGGLFISKTPCLGDMNPLISRVLVPVMRGVGLAPHVVSFRMSALEPLMRAAGFEVVAREGHASKGRDTRPYFVARRH